MILIEGFLALNMTLRQVAENRQGQPVYYPIAKDAMIEGCLLGVPYGYGFLIGERVLFKPDASGQFMMLVADVEQAQHHPYMTRRKLIDTNCPDLVHQRGQIVVKRTAH